MKEIPDYLLRKYECDTWRYVNFKKGEFNFKIRCCDCGLRHNIVLSTKGDELFMGFKRLEE